MKAVESSNLNKNFKVCKEEINVLKDLNFVVDKGEFLSIMGTSGCGKSTLLYLLGGLDKPSSGIVNVNGRDLSKISEKQKSIMKRRELEFVFQFYNLVPNLSVEDSILLPIILDEGKLKIMNRRLQKF